ncbi:MAG: bifunctional proline dehydrogenase/L-glutamate gamma-semialdehyde dehydrogenase PutA [Pseudomonadota bacterium]
MDTLSSLRSEIRAAHRAPSSQVLAKLVTAHAPDQQRRVKIGERATEYIKTIRHTTKPSLMEAFLGEYGLTTDEGIALMCLAEALLRVPDPHTIDELIEDKIVPSAWGQHLGQSSSSLVNASTWALMLTGKVLEPEAQAGIGGILRGAVKRVGEPIIRTAVKQAMKELGRQFVLGETIQSAVKNGRSEQSKGYTYSYDMLGEAAMTMDDADTFYDAYHEAIAALAKEATSDNIRENPGISIKLSALHPRYDTLQRQSVLDRLVPRTLSLARAAKAAGMGLNIDAEEADRLDLSLDIIERVLADESLEGWDGFGVVVQAYGKRAGPVIDWLHALAEHLDRKIMIRLVKGAYWDAEIKQSQVGGEADFPVFAQKAETDVSYICCTNKLLSMTDRIYPQFATHNAHSIAAILNMAGNLPAEAYELQRLHGMGEEMHDTVLAQGNVTSRIYAPVGAHRDLLAYLVRRLLENGANSSFVNQIVDEDVPIERVAADPFEQLSGKPNQAIRLPADLFEPTHRNSRGWNIRNEEDREAFRESRRPHDEAEWMAGPLLADGNSAVPEQGGVPVINPSRPRDEVGKVWNANSEQVEFALANEKPWDATPAKRANILRAAANLYEAKSGLFFAYLAREAGKTAEDAINELREAADFLRFYASEAERLADRSPRGVVTCISPWNFPLAIFTGQIAAALAAGNGVLAKPAEQTPLIAHMAVSLLHEAGVPRTALQLVPGPGREIGAALTSDPRVDMVCFTGSTATAQAINRAMAENLATDAPLIAETGGLNAMILDSTALPEQAVGDIIASAFQSAGQRCSALRMLYVQEDVAERFKTMLFGAMDCLTLGNPWDLNTDVGPVIDQAAREKIINHIETARHDGRLLKELKTPGGNGYWVGPSVIGVSGIDDLEEEIFGPVLHLATFQAKEIDDVITAINNKGFGLTFGLHTRIDSRVEDITTQIRAGNMYINRNQIGAVVSSQPFGGEGLSGTGPKAGGPHYVERFCAPKVKCVEADHDFDEAVFGNEVQKAIDTVGRPADIALTTEDRPGPTGESNRLSTFPRGLILCLGPGESLVRQQIEQVKKAGCTALGIATGLNSDEGLSGEFAYQVLGSLTGFDGVAYCRTGKGARAIRKALSGRDGPLIPLISEMGEGLRKACLLERHICIDTTAAGGNATLLAEVEG